MSRLFQIREEDLAELEHSIPMLCGDVARGCRPGTVSSIMDARIRAQIRRVQTILANVRWNYGPPEEIEIIPVNEPPEGPDE